MKNVHALCFACFLLIFPSGLFAQFVPDGQNWMFYSNNNRSLIIGSNETGSLLKFNIPHTSSSIHRNGLAGDAVIQAVSSKRFLLTSSGAIQSISLAPSPAATVGLHVFPSGNVTIGSDWYTSPSDKLKVEGSIKSSGNIYANNSHKVAAVSQSETITSTWRFNSGLNAYGSSAFYIDGLNDFTVGKYNSSRIQMGVAEGNGHFCNGTQAGDFVIRRMGDGSKFIITHGGTPNSYPASATGILASQSTNGLWVYNNGNIRLGNYSATPPTVKLAVHGTVQAKEIIVEAKTADFVFEPDYQLRSLEEVEGFILKNRHLPEVPSAQMMGKEGVGLAEMNQLLLMKVEELTLYMIEQQKRLNDQQALLNQLLVNLGN